MVTIRDQQSIDWNSAANSTTPMATAYDDRYAAVYLANSWLSDMSFYVEQDKLSIPAHSFVVAIASPLLQHLCFGGGDKVQDGCVIVVPKCSAADFYVLLRYLYGCGTSGPHGQIRGLTGDNAIAVLLLADVYDLRLLADSCVELLTYHLSVDNVCAVYENVHLMGNAQGLKEQCVQYIQCNASALLQNGSAMRMGMDVFKMVLAAKTVAITEAAFQALIVWADQELRTRNGDEAPITSAGRRSILNEHFVLESFASLHIEEFIRCIQCAGCNFFTAAEIGIIFQRIVSTDPNSLLEQQ